MSEQVQTKDPFERVADVLEMGKDVPQSFSSLYTEKNNEHQYCALGWLNHCSGIDDKYQSAFGALFRLKPRQDTLSRYGFSKEQLEKEFVCPEPDCNQVHVLGSLIPHLNDDHEISRPNIGKIILALRDCNQETPNFLQGIITSFKNSCRIIKTSFN